MNYSPPQRHLGYQNGLFTLAFYFRYKQSSSLNYGLPQRHLG